MKKYLIKDIRDGKEVAFILIDGTMPDIILAIIEREDRTKEEVSAWDHYEVSVLRDGISAYQPVARLFASDYVRAW